MRYAIFHIQHLRQTKTAGKLARSVVVGKAPNDRQVARNMRGAALALSLFVYS